MQAAIAAIHDEAPAAEDTDWRQILGLYQLLERMSPNPMVTLNHAVAAAMSWPGGGLAMLSDLEADERIAEHHRLEAVPGHLLEMAGDPAGARAAYQLAAHRTTSVPERRYLRSAPRDSRPDRGRQALVRPSRRRISGLETPRASSRSAPRNRCIRSTPRANASANASSSASASS